MLHKLVKPLIGLGLLSLSYLIGSHVYRYYTHAEPPQVSIEGLKADAYYKGTIEAKVVANNPYKIAIIEAELDHKPFTSIPAKPNSRKIAHTFSINSEQLENGEHLLKIHAIDASKNKNASTQLISFNVDNLPLSAAFIQENYRIDQGKTAHIKIKLNKHVASVSIKTLSQQFEAYQDAPGSTTYECFIPISCEEMPAHHDVVVEITDHVGQYQKLSTTLEVLLYNFPKQKGFSVDAEKLSSEREISVKQSVLGDAIARWLTESPKEKLWHGPFVMPMQVRRITTPFGEIRVTPEKGRYLHKGLDLVNMPRSIVWAAQHGKIIIKDRFAMTGNTVVIDHGLGITTIYAHLDSFADIEVGQMIKKGNPVGKVGMTGYANGYHLHWELQINGTAVDPVEWTEKVY